MSDSSAVYGRSGYGNFGRLLAGAAFGGLIGLIVEAKYDDLDLEYLANALAPISLMVIFGLGYVGKDLPERLSLYGPQREAAAFRLVTVLFVIALGTVTAILGYGIWPPERDLCPFLCDMTLTVGESSPIRLFHWSPSDLFRTGSIGGLGATLGGFLQMFVVMLRPPLLDPEVVPRRLILRRFVARAVDTMAVWWLVSVLLSAAWMPRLVEETGTWVLVAVVALVAGAYEMIPFLWFGGSLGKLITQVRVVSIQSSKATSFETRCGSFRVVLRILVTALVWSPVSEVILLASGVNSLPGWFLNTHLGVGGLLLASVVAHSSGQGIHDIPFRTTVVPRTPLPAGGGEDRSQRPVGPTRHSPARQWRPSAFTVGETPFAHDLLDRRGQVEAVSQEILNRPVAVW